MHSEEYISKRIHFKTCIKKQVVIIFIQFTQTRMEVCKYCRPCFWYSHNLFILTELNFNKINVFLSLFPSSRWIFARMNVRLSFSTWKLYRNLISIRFLQNWTSVALLSRSEIDYFPETVPSPCLFCPNISSYNKHAVAPAFRFRRYYTPLVSPRLWQGGYSYFFRQTSEKNVNGGDKNQLARLTDKDTSPLQFVGKLKSSSSSSSSSMSSEENIDTLWPRFLLCFRRKKKRSWFKLPRRRQQATKFRLKATKTTRMTAKGTINGGQSFR